MVHVREKLRLALSWLWVRADTLVALVLSGYFAYQGIGGSITKDQFSNAALAILTLFAFILVRDRGSREQLKSELAAIREHLSFSRHPIDIIPPSQIQRDLERAMLDTSYWHYKGGCGTYLRAVTMRTIGEQAKKDRTPRALDIQIIDPTNLAVCESYSNYRRSVDSRSEKTLGDWDIKHVRIEAYATVLAACVFKNIYPLVSIRLGLCGTMSLFRYDLSLSYIIITQESKAAPAMKAAKDSHYYRAYYHELDCSMKQTKVVPLDQVKNSGFTWETPHEALTLLKLVGVFDQDFLTDTHLQLIIQRANHAVNPYG